VALGAVGAWAVLRSPTVGRGLLVWMFALSLLVYSWASEKFAWLVLHPLLPLILLAGIGVQTVWEARGRLAGRAGLAVAVAGALYLGWTSYQANAVHSADPRELLVSTQSSPEVKRVAREVLRLDRRTPGRLSIAIDGDEGATFPWAWYFRDEAAGYVEDMGAPGYRPEAQVLIMTDASREALAPQLAGYRGRRFDFRDWWVKDYGGALSPGNWWRWATRREPWNATGGLPEWIYIRRDV
jgi:predicted membrane-bound mannosyltransferase